MDEKRDVLADLFVSADDPTQWSAVPANLRRLASWEGVPLTFKILVSQQPHLTRSMTEDDTKMTSITGDFQAGRDKLMAFLEELLQRDLLDHDDIQQSINDLAKGVLFSIDPTPQNVILQLKGSAADQADQVLAEVSDIDDLIDREVNVFKEMKAAGDGQQQIWRRLGLVPPAGFTSVPSGSKSGADAVPTRKPDTGRQSQPTISYDNANKSSRHRATATVVTPPIPDAVTYKLGPSRPRVYMNAPVISRAVRPGGVTFVSVMSIIGGVISALICLWLAVAVLSYSGQLAFLELLCAGLGVATIVLGVKLLGGSMIARRIYVVVSVIGAIGNFILISRTGVTFYAVLTLVVTTVYIIILYTENANDYFEEKSG